MATWMNVFTPVWCFQVPVFWPVSPFMFTWACNFSIQAGWYLGVASPTNTLRIFVSPTLTWAVGTAVCFGGPAIAVGNSLPMGVFSTCSMRELYCCGKVITKL